MACRTPAAENAADTPATILINKKIVELKKKILLAEGQKKAYIGEWSQREKQNSDNIGELKKEIKELTGKLSCLNNVSVKRCAKDPPPVTRRVAYPPGARSAEDAVKITDLKLIDQTKRLDLLNDRYQRRKEHFDKLYEQYQQLVADRSAQLPDGTNEHVSATLEEDQSRKLICHLENEIHRTNVQWMEAEHIRKKYRSIKATLMADSEKFEKSLLELEQSITEQQADINRMQEIHRDAVQMRDGTKVVLLRQEHAAHVSTKTRDRQAFDFRRQVEERKVELERLERKLFSTGKPTSLVHQPGSVESLSGEQQSGAKRTVRQDTNEVAQEMTAEMEGQFKRLMEVTGATTPLEVLDRFVAQKESTTRLNYLRTVTEGEKKHLEMQREVLMQTLETTKFADVKETEENQEQLEMLKQSIAAEQQRQQECQAAASHTVAVIESIKSTLLDLTLKLQEVDEAIDPNRPEELTDFISGNVSNELLLQILEDKFRKGLVCTGQTVLDVIDQDRSERPTGPFDDDGGESFRPEDLHMPIALSTPSPTPRPTSQLAHDERERPQPYPSCYNGLMGGRTTGQMSSTSPGQGAAPVATDDEGDVPTRSYLKRQAQYILDAKSRRKGFRPARR